jgi:hypothetical protein
MATSNKNTEHSGVGDTTVSGNAAQRELVRNLAGQVNMWAHSDAMQLVRRRWRDVNALRRPDRAPVWCRPVGAWDELLPDENLECTDPWLRGLEREFRRLLFKKDIGDDTPLEPWYGVNAVFERRPANLWGLQTGQHKPSESTGAWGYDPPLKSHADFEKLCMPEFSFDQKTSNQLLERHSDLLGDILPVKMICNDSMGATLGYDAAELRGLEQMMMDMIMEPELIHRLMKHMLDATLASMDAREASGLVTANNYGPMTSSDNFGGSGDTFSGCWCMANSQEFDQVSPDMWAEFCLAYQKPIFERYGLVGYGCCENLTHKIDGVLSIPNLRIFVCSAWSNLETVLEKVSNDYCIMWRQKASDVVFPDDGETIANDLDEGARQLSGRYYQIVLRELQTLAGHPDRLQVWTRSAIEAAEKYC